jgi:hypothetical protein
MPAGFGQSARRGGGMSGDATLGMLSDNERDGSRSSPVLELPAEDLVRLTEGAAMTVEVTPATGSRLKGSHWVAELREINAWASAMGLEETLEALAVSAVGAAHELLVGAGEERDAGLATAVRVLALDRSGELVDALREAEVVSAEYERSILPAEGGFATGLGEESGDG